MATLSATIQLSRRSQPLQNRRHPSQRDAYVLPVMCLHSESQIAVLAWKRPHAVVRASHWRTPIKADIRFWKVGP